MCIIDSKYTTQELKDPVKVEAVLFLIIRRTPRSTLSSSSAASDVYKRQLGRPDVRRVGTLGMRLLMVRMAWVLSLIHISEPTRLLSISYPVFCLQKKKTRNSTPILCA